jgi:hypothetical protein
MNWYVILKIGETIAFLISFLLPSMIFLPASVKCYKLWQEKKNYGYLRSCFAALLGSFFFIFFFTFYYVKRQLL